MKALAAAALLLSVLFVPSGARADTETEVSHLLQYIEHSDCIFIRNGQEHGSAEALEHIRMKYDYVRKKVRTAEDFIDYAATKSSLTGRLYQVLCGEARLPTSRWLRNELTRFREARRAP